MPSAGAYTPLDAPSAAADPRTRAAPAPPAGGPPEGTRLMTTATPPIDLAAWEQLLGDPANADENDLNQLHEQLDARARELQPKVADKTLDDTEMAELRDIIPALRTTGAQRAEWASARDSAYGEFGEFFTEQDAANADPETEQGDGEGGDTEQGGEDTGDGEQGGQDTGAESVVAASANKPGKRPPATTKARVPDIGTTAAHAPKDPHAADRGNGRVGTAVVAAADLRGVSAGSAIKFDQFGDYAAKKMQALDTTNQLASGREELVPIATLQASGVPDDRSLSRYDWASNTRKLNSTTNERAIVAAGGFCAPMEIDYTYNTIGVTGRPVRDALPTFQAERGGIMFRPDISPVTNTASDGPRSATGVWTADNDVHAYDVTDPPRKAVWKVDCPPVVTAQVDAITLQTEWSNVTSRFDPETVQANMEAAMIHHDRFAENRLMGQIRAASKSLTSAQVFGATRDLLGTLDRTQAYIRSVHRLSANIPLRAIMPQWARPMIRVDMAASMNVADMSNLNITDAQVDSWLSSRGLNPIWHLDGNTAATTSPTVAAQQYTLASANTAVPGFPAQLEILMFPEGSFTFLDGGTLDLGIVRDSTLIDKNRYRNFTESWEGVAVRGPEPIRLAATVTPNGKTAGTV